MLLVLQRAQMLVDDGDGVGEKLRRAVPAVLQVVPVLVQGQLLLVVAQLVEQAIAQIAAGDPGRIQLADDFEGFVQIGERELRLVDGMHGG